MNDEFEFYHETCQHCVYFLRTPGHVTFDICRYWVPNATAINQHPYPTHVDEDRPACGCYRRNPFLKEEQPVDDNPKAIPASEIGEVE
jgi:hypothetical protein